MVDPVAVEEILDLAFAVDFPGRYRREPHGILLEYGPGNARAGVTIAPGVGGNWATLGFLVAEIKTDDHMMMLVVGLLLLFLGLLC